MGLSNILVVVVLLLGAAILGFISAWLIRQSRIDQLMELMTKMNKENVEKDSIVDQYHVDRDILKEEVEKYKQSYNTQVMKTQRLHENIRQNQLDLERAQERMKELQEMYLQSEEKINVLKQELLSRPKSVRRVVSQETTRIADSIKKGGLSLLDKKKS